MTGARRHVVGVPAAKTSSATYRSLFALLSMSLVPKENI